MSFFDQIGKNPLVKDFVAGLGFGKTSAQKEAEEKAEQARKAYESLETPALTKEHPDFATATDQTPSEMGTVSVNPAYKESQMEQLAALSNLAKNGGRNAATDYNLARIRSSELANAKGQRDAVMANANARGMGGSGAELVAQLAGNQAAQSNANMEDMAVAGQEANLGINAGANAANIGAGLENQDFNQAASKAQAQDAINRFNASNRTNMNTYNTGIANDAQKFNTGLEQSQYQNKVQKQAGIAGANMGAVPLYSAQADKTSQWAGNLASGGFQAGASAFKPAAAGAGGAGAGGGAAAGGAATAGEALPMAAMVAARGGKIPGAAPISGDSTLNDIVPIKASPGEVVVPRSLAKTGNSHQIANFVKNPPKVGQDREAMLSALQNIRRKRGGF